MLKPRFNVGQRVRVRIGADVVHESEIVCDVGLIIGVQLVHPTSIYERIEYIIRLDGIYAKRKIVHDIGPKVTVFEGFNASPHTYIIEEVK